MYREAQKFSDILRSMGGGFSKRNLTNLFDVECIEIIIYHSYLQKHIFYKNGINILNKKEIKKTYLIKLKFLK